MNTPLGNFEELKIKNEILKTKKNDVKNKLGAFIFEFGELEASLRPLIIATISFKMSFENDNNILKLFRSMLKRMDGVNQNLEIFKSVVEIFIDEINKPIWEKLISNISELNVYRNKVVHNCWFVNEEKVSKFNKTFDVIEMNMDELVEKTEKLKYINRQMMDFLERCGGLIRPEILLFINLEDRLL